MPESPIKLTKHSSPGWEKQFNDWPSLLKELLGWVCRDCQASHHYRFHQVMAHEFAAGKLKEEAIQLAEAEASFCLPNNFHRLDDEERIGILLATSCGAEFTLEIKE